VSRDARWRTQRSDTSGYIGLFVMQVVGYLDAVFTKAATPGLNGITKQHVDARGDENALWSSIARNC